MGGGARTSRTATGRPHEHAGAHHRGGDRAARRARRPVDRARRSPRRRSAALRSADRRAARDRVPAAGRRRGGAGVPPMTGADAQAVAIAAAVRARRVSAREVVAAALARIAQRDRVLNCFTHVAGDAALAEAERLDARVAAGQDPGPLAGVPFAVKNLFDVAGVITLAGSKIHADRPPAARDATAVAALRRAGAVMVGALNMDEYAYGFTTENTHYGPTRNPHDSSRVPG